MRRRAFIPFAAGTDLLIFVRTRIPAVVRHSFVHGEVSTNPRVNSTLSAVRLSNPTPAFLDTALAELRDPTGALPKVTEVRVERRRSQYENAECRHSGSLDVIDDFPE